MTSSDGRSTPSSAPAGSSITTETRVSLIPMTCVRCRQPVPAGQKHLRHTDRRQCPPVRFTECGACARRAGRGAALG